MREFLFRGKQIDNDEWRYGGVYHQEEDEIKDEAVYIIGGSIFDVGCAYPVDPETVGQFTGLIDKDGKKIFEGDILEGFEYPYFADGSHNYYGEVVWLDNCPAFGIYTHKYDTSKVRGISEGNCDIIEDFDSSMWKILGNIHDDQKQIVLSEYANTIDAEAGVKHAEFVSYSSICGGSLVLNIDGKECRFSVSANDFTENFEDNTEGILVTYEGKPIVIDNFPKNLKKYKVWTLEDYKGNE